MSYRATEMDLNSIFGELFKYVSKLLITLYYLANNGVPVGYNVNILVISVAFFHSVSNSMFV